MTSDTDLLGRIHALVEEERQLRSRRENDELDAESEQRRLAALEVELDQCWDLLRQRRALRDSGQDPSTATARPAGQVEGYLG